MGAPDVICQVPTLHIRDQISPRNPGTLSRNCQFSCAATRRENRASTLSRFARRGPTRAQVKDRDRVVSMGFCPRPVGRRDLNRYRYMFYRSETQSLWRGGVRPGEQTVELSGLRTLQGVIGALATYDSLLTKGVRTRSTASASDVLNIGRLNPKMRA